jgi:hypothetical protein
LKSLPGSGVVGGSGVLTPIYKELPVGRGVVFCRFVVTRAFSLTAFAVVVSASGLCRFANGFFFGRDVAMTLSEPLQTNKPHYYMFDEY